MTPTDRLQQVMTYIQTHTVEHGRAPRLEDIQSALDFSSKSRAHAAITDLCTLGYLVRDKHHARGLRILKTWPEDWLESAAADVCRAVGAPADPALVAKARDILFSRLIERRAA